VIEEGYAPAELGLEITEGMTAPPLRFVMAPVGAPLRIESLPEGATVRIDGRALPGRGEGLVLSPGPHEVRLETKGFLPQVQRVDAEPGKHLAIVARLEPMPATQPGQPRIAPSPPPAGRPAPSLPVSVPTVKKPLVRGAFVELDETMTPPRHVSGEPAPYPQAARKLRLKGSVLVEMIVTEDGQPRDLRVLESAGAILDQAVVEAVERWRFKPALKQGTAVRVHWKYKQSFVPAL
jgi:TonB family protein